MNKKTKGFKWTGWIKPAIQKGKIKYRTITIGKDGNMKLEIPECYHRLTKSEARKIKLSS